MDFLILIAGIAGLWLGTELTIGSAMAIARRHQLSEFFVGLVILSIGSDLPELAVAVDAGIKGLLGTDASLRGSMTMSMRPYSLASIALMK